MREEKSSGRRMKKGEGTRECRCGISIIEEEEGNGGGE